ncbi:MAG: VOC family protein [Ectothiorhodospiraceae bacterium]|nr:VOC family protein [Chromatiales bacterium]MCP5154794.1 VOC family protein [Ectothiorhodospiraceae bacterium]
MALASSIITGVQQVALVVRDLDAALVQYTERLGIGPWWVKVYAPPELTNMRVRGVETPYSMKLAIAWTGDTMWELIEPLDGPSIYKEFLEAHGEGLHHLLVDHREGSMEAAIAAFGRRGCPPLMEGQIGTTRFCYLESEGPLKTTLEIVHREPGFKRPEPDYWFPARESAGS